MRLSALLFAALVIGVGACGDDEAPAEETCAAGAFAEGPIPETGDAELDACADQMEGLEADLEELLPRITQTCVAVAEALGAEDTWSSEAGEVERMRKACAAATSASQAFSCQVQGCALSVSAAPGSEEAGAEAAAAIGGNGDAFLSACGCGGDSALSSKARAFFDACAEVSVTIGIGDGAKEPPSCAVVAYADRAGEAIFRADAALETACAALGSWGCSPG